MAAEFAFDGSDGVLSTDKDLNHPAVRQLPGYSEFLDEKLDAEAFRKDPGLVRRLLEIFRRSMDLGTRQEGLLGS